MRLGDDFATTWARDRQWQSWYAWRPVGVNYHGIRWLEPIERKRKSYWMRPRWDYRLPEKKTS